MPVRGVLSCPRCRVPVEANGRCLQCGRYVTPMTWVAIPPPGTVSPPRVRLPRYSGPPRYPFIPRWGFPALPWTEPEEAAPPQAPDALTAARTTLGTLVPLLWATATVAVLACGAEVWRYTLLLASRSDALPAGAVAASDALVAAAGTVAPILAIVAGVMLVLWSVRTSRAAGDHAGVVPARSARAIVAGWLLPVVNLSVPGSVLAEIEHTGMERPARQRPRPSALLVWWWALWVANLLFGLVVVLWSLRTGVQALADGVVLHALLDLLAAVTAGVTAVLTARLTRLLTPRRTARREVLVAVR
ncbi:MAG TPA: DUF4328 domain-containing protein [Pseudonocardia sp.]